MQTRTIVNSNEPSKHNKSFIFGLSAVLLWSTVATAFKFALVYLTPTQLLFYASLTSIFVLGLICWKQNRLNLVTTYLRSRFRLFVCLGLLNPTLYYLILFEAYERLPAQQAQSLNCTWAITMTLLSVPLLKQKISKNDWLACLFGYLGVVVIATQGNLLSLEFESPLGVGLALLSTVFWALFWILNTKNTGDPVVSLLICFLLGTPCIGLLLWWEGGFHFIAWEGFFSAVYVGLCEMGIAFVLWLMALKHAENTAKVSNLFFLSPFLSLIFIHFLLGEQIHSSVLVGLVLIMLGQWVQRKPRKT